MSLHPMMSRGGPVRAMVLLAVVSAGLAVGAAERARGRPQPQPVRGALRNGRTLLDHHLQRRQHSRLFGRVLRLQSPGEHFGHRRDRVYVRHHDRDRELGR